MTSRKRIFSSPSFAVFGIGLVLLAIYAMIFLPYMPNARGEVGHDFSMGFPRLLSGYYWFLHNGLWSFPWFSPAECGGFPYYPDPSGPYFSVPQFLVFVVSPLTAVRWTLLSFAAIGFAGFYWLMRRGFASSRSAAILAASFFMFNGFFTYRMIVGHLSFHAFMLLPVVAAAIITVPNSASVGIASRLVRVFFAALCLAYMIHAGMNHIVPPLLMSISVILLIQVLLYGWQWAPWLNLIGAGLLAIALFAGKLAAEFSLLASFPRDYYPLPGIRDIATTLEMTFRTLFFNVPPSAPRAVVNSAWLLDRHEWEYGVSPAPLIFIVGGALLGLLNWVRNKAWPRLDVIRGVALAAIVVLLILPMALNLYTPGWNQFLKGLPLLGKSSNLLRWISAYIAVAVLLAGLALDRFPLPVSISSSGRKILAGLGILVMLIANLGTDRAFYANQSYAVATVEAAWKAVTKTGVVPNIENIAVRPPNGFGVSDGLTKGISTIMCYQPLMGYRLEKFPVGQLRPGPIFNQANNSINMKNPACYAFPEENHCKPGDQFLPEMRADAEAFASYRPFPFNRPASQIFADYLSLFTLLSILLFFAVFLFFEVRRRKEKATVSTGPDESEKQSLEN